MDYQAILANVVLPKLKEFGKPITIKQQTSVVGDWVKSFDAVESQYIWTNEATGEIVYEEPVGSINESVVDGIESAFKKKDIDGDFVKAGDIQLYITPDVTPSLGDIVVLADKDYTVYHIEPIRPASLVLMYLLYIRTANG